MSVFQLNRAYQPQFDIRFADGVAPNWAEPLVEGRPANGQCWLVVMPRRGGKTWLARAIEQARGQAPTVRVDLRNGRPEAERLGVGCLLGGKGPPRFRRGVLLVDEPGIGQGGGLPKRLATGLRTMDQSGVVPIVLVTPGEHVMLAEHLGPEAPKDVVYPPRLDDAETDRMFRRAPDWAPAVADGVRRHDPAWLNSPYLLELLMHVAEQQWRLRSDIPQLLRSALLMAKRQNYLPQVLTNGLDSDQRADLRASRWLAAGVEVPRRGTRYPLERTPVLADPVVADHQPEILRIHHISDLHHGGDLRANVDRKDRTKAGRQLAQVVGAGTPLDSYLEHLRGLGRESRAPHLVVVTGDVVNRPLDSNAVPALDWLDTVGRLLAEHPDLRPEDPRVLLVGGNHDVSWDQCVQPDPQVRHRWFAETFAAYPHPELHRPAEQRDRLEVRYPDAGLRIALFGSSESGGERTLAAEHGEVEEQLAKLHEAVDQEEVSELIRGFEQLDPAAISRTVLDRLTVEAGTMTLAAMHHPLVQVPSVEVAPYTGLINGGQVRQALARARTALVMHGHTHLAFFAAERLLGDAGNGSGTGWTMRIAGAATLAAATTNEQNGYNQILIARHGGEHTVVVRPVRFEGGSWNPGGVIAFRPGAADELPITGLLEDPPEVR